MVVVVFCQLWSLERSIKILHYFYSTDLLLLLFLSNKNDRENLGEFCPLTSLFLEILHGIYICIYILLHPVTLYITTIINVSTDVVISQMFLQIHCFALFTSLCQLIFLAVNSTNLVSALIVFWGNQVWNNKTNKFLSTIPRRASRNFGE